MRTQSHPEMHIYTHIHAHKQPALAFVRFLCPANLVNIPDMVVERACLRETLATHMAFVRSLSCVGPSVLYQVLIQSKTLPAYITYVRLKVNVTAIVPLQ